MTFSVTQNGKLLLKKKYTWDPETKTFSTKENDLVLDFSGMNGVTFRTGRGCTFNTGGDCTFKTGWYCTFNTGGYCTFRTGGGCTFNTGWYCTFNTGGYCTFKTFSPTIIRSKKECTLILDNKVHPLDQILIIYPSPSSLKEMWAFYSQDMNIEKSE